MYIAVKAWKCTFVIPSFALLWRNTWRLSLTVGVDIWIDSAINIVVIETGGLLRLAVKLMQEASPTDMQVLGSHLFTNH